MTPLPIPDAARVLGIRHGTLARWLREGCPVAARGRRGRGCATLVDPAAVREWREAGAVEPSLREELRRAIPQTIADAALETAATFSLRAQTGAEHRLLHEAIAVASRASTAAVLALLEKTKKVARL